MSQSQFRAPRGKLRTITEGEELTDEQEKKADERAYFESQAKKYLSRFEFGGSKTKRKNRRTRRTHRTRRTKRRTKRRTRRKTKRKAKRRTKRR